MKLNVRPWSTSAGSTPPATSTVDSVPPSGGNSRPDSIRESALVSSGQATPTAGGRGNRVTLVEDSARYKVMIKYMYGRVTNQNWLPDAGSGKPRGVLLRKVRGEYICEPENIDPVLLDAVKTMNVEVAFTMATETVSAILNTLTSGQTEIYLGNGSQLQIIDSLASISTSTKKLQYAALIREEKLMLVWHDDLDRIMNHAARLEDKLLGLVWGTTVSPFSFAYTPGTSANPSLYNFAMEKEKAPIEIVEEVLEDGQARMAKESLARPLVFTSSVYAGLACLLIIVLLLGFGTSNLLGQSLVDGFYVRFALVATEPIFMLFSIFFAIVLFTNIFQVAGPIGSLKTNSRFFSAIKPDLSQCYAGGFSPPHITIQMPVYKESLTGVIIPTVTSLKAAISHYESHGGSASIFMNDDGFAFLTDAEREERINFYHDNNIGWVARPKHNDNGYLRRGKFKKASNMNFALNISQKVESLLRTRVEAKLSSEKSDRIEAHEEETFYNEALAEVLAADPRATAAGNIRVGEFILIVDSDTQVPVDCLLYGAAEMFLSPEVAIVQHSTGVMQVSWDYFENGITYFTNLIYSAVTFAVGSGETAPFVGHNSFLRWEAVQSVGRKNQPGEAEDYVAYWSEQHVSEDFDMALRLQIAGNVVRLAAYHDNEFKEGVSLTIYDELARWEKYAYGCNELVFNPIHTWLWKGPITPLFRTFLFSDMQLSSKITIIGYISSYYALASGFPFTIMNYFLVGWFNGYLDKFYMESWKVFLGLVVVFSAMGNVSLAILRYRLAEKGLWAALCENFKWMPMFAVFFGGLPFNLNLALLAHMFKIDMQWGATAKEVERSNFFMEIPKIFKSFKYMYMIVVPMMGAMIYLGCFAPKGWEITEIAAVIPMAMTLASHALLPFLLNPSLMIFNY
ncbi:NCP1 protein [Venturia nashicola]|nr:NCP1 protein [Venturia nashicola]